MAKGKAVVYSKGADREGCVMAKGISRHMLSARWQAGRIEGSLVPCVHKHNTVEFLADNEGNCECLLCHSQRNYEKANGRAFDMVNYWELPLKNNMELQKAAGYASR